MAEGRRQQHDFRSQRSMANRPILIEATGISSILVRHKRLGHHFVTTYKLICYVSSQPCGPSGNY